jgi:hypothetical protein
MSHVHLRHVTYLKWSTHSRGRTCQDAHALKGADVSGCPRVHSQDAHVLKG